MLEKKYYSIEMNVCFKVYLVICRQFLWFQKNCPEGVTCPAKSGVCPKYAGNSSKKCYKSKAGLLSR